MQAPQRVSHNLMPHRIAFSRTLLCGLQARPRRGQHIQAVSGADGMDAEHVHGVADHHQTPQMIGTRDHSQPLHRLRRAGAVRFRDDRRFRHARAHQVLLAHAALGVRVAACAAQGDEQRRDTAIIKALGMVQPRAVNRRGLAVVLGRAEHRNRIGGSCLVHRSIAIDLPGHGPAPRHRHCRQNHQPAAPTRRAFAAAARAAPSALLTGFLSSASCLALQNHDYLVRGYGALAQDHPAARPQREIDDGGGQRAPGGTAVDDQRNAIADLVAHAGRVGALRRALQIGRRSRDRQPKTLHHRARNGRVRHADGHVAGVRRGAQRKPAAGAHNNRQRPGPELVGQPVKRHIQVAGQLIGLRHRSDQQRKRLVLLPAFELVNLLHRAQVHRVHGQPIKRIGGQGNHVALAQAGNDVIDPVCLRLIGMDAQNLRGQETYPRN